MDKESLRKRMMQMRSAMSADEKKRKEEILSKILFASQVWHDAPGIAIFASYKDELNTGGIIEHAWKEGKEVFTPKVIDRKNRKMNFIKINTRKDLQTGYMGIPEPVSDLATKVTPEILVLLPGLAFDRQGWRLGYGGGFYDAFLGSLIKRPVTVGLCFSDQIVAAVPHDHYDVAIDGICSDAGLEWFINGSRDD